jgi:hypothetical protein
MKMLVSTKGQPSRPGVAGRFTYHLHLFDEPQATGNLFGSLYADTICDASVRLMAICGDLGAYNGELTVTGPWYAPDDPTPPPHKRAAGH